MTKKKPRNGPTPDPTSLRSYAKRRGLSVNAISKAVKTGRLKAAVVMVRGAPKIPDHEAADREWDARTQTRVDQPPPESRPRRQRGPVHGASIAEEALEEVADEAAELAGVPNYFVSRAKKEAAGARRESALADLAEIDVLERRGELVPVDEARRDVIEKFSVVRTKILGVPSRVAQSLPHVSAADVRLIDDLLREALEELADADGDGEEEDASDAA